MATFFFNSPTKPPALHTRDLEAGNVRAEPNSAHKADHKRSLKTGSRKRVIRHYIFSLLVGLLIGCIIGMAIGLAIRYTVGKH
jgi:Flp pilus assembly protein TadB